MNFKKYYYWFCTYYATRLPYKHMHQNQKQTKTNYNTCLHAFSSALSQLHVHVITSSLDWFTALSVSLVIGHSDYYDTQLKTAHTYRFTEWKCIIQSIMKTKPKSESLANRTTRLYSFLVVKWLWKCFLSDSLTIIAYYKWTLPLAQPATLKGHL